MSGRVTRNRPHGKPITIQYEEEDTSSSSASSSKIKKSHSTPIKVKSDDKDLPSTSNFSKDLSSFAKKQPVKLKSKKPLPTTIVHDDPTEILLKKEDTRRKHKDESHGTTSSFPDEFSESEAKESSPKRLKWTPENWKSVLKFIKVMRKPRDAPVDTMGCERTMEDGVEPKVRRFQALVSLMLSSQTKDQVTYAAMERLKVHGLTVQNILDTDESNLGKLIYPVGFWKKKTDYIKRATEILREKYDDDIPDTIKGLTSLPGVGQKMAYIAMSVAWDKNEGIGVDTHVHRIANRLKWTGPKGTKTPDKTREALESWMPESDWQEINILLVGFGQTICTPINPKCGSCLANQFCPFGLKELNGQK